MFLRFRIIKIIYSYFHQLLTIALKGSHPVKMVTIELKKEISAIIPESTLKAALAVMLSKVASLIMPNHFLLRRVCLVGL